LIKQENKDKFFELLDKHLQTNDKFEVDKEKKDADGEAAIIHVKLLDFNVIFTDLVKIDSSKI